MDIQKALSIVINLLRNAYVVPKIGEQMANSIEEYLKSQVGQSRLGLEYVDIIIHEINAILSYHSKDQHLLITKTQQSANNKTKDFPLAFRGTNYLYIASMEHISDTNMRRAYISILNSVTSPLIIDLRGCVGGAAITVYFLLCHFFDDGTHIYDRVVNTPTGQQASPVIVGSVARDFEPNYRIKKFTGEVKVLISSWTFSGGEIFAAVMQAQNRAKIYGTKTVGMTNLTKQEHIGMLVLNLPYSGTIIRGTKYGPSGRNIENIGVIPDYEPQSKEYIQVIYNDLSEINLKNFESPNNSSKTIIADDKH